MNTGNENAGVEMSGNRPETVGALWGWTMGMVVICLLLFVVLRTAAVPLILFIGVAGLLTLYIWSWNIGERASRRDEEEIEALRSQVRDLEQRLENVEVINAFGEKLAEREQGRAVGETDG